MKRKVLLVLFGMVLTVLLAQSLVTQPGHAHTLVDCDEDRLNAFMDADSQYTSTFRSWYFGDPETCGQECANQCSQGATSQCLECMENCDSSRYSAFTSAQDSLMAAANQSCPFNPDFCDQARHIRDQCVATRASYMQNPVLDENGNIDSTWRNFVIDEYWACWSASGVGACE